jgi:hypothetical protein
MKELKFCPYNVEYQQRLGFLKILVSLLPEDRSPPNKVRLLERLKFLFVPATKAPAYPLLKERMDEYGPLDKPSRRKRGEDAVLSFGDALVRHRSLASWQLGFFADRLDRLWVWGNWLGLVGREGQITEWGLTLRRNIESETRKGVTSGSGWPNPFVLTPAERAIFLQLMLFSDHVFIPLIINLSRIPISTTITSPRASLLAFLSMVDLLRIHRTFASLGADGLAVRELAEVLKQIAVEFRIEVPKVESEVNGLMEAVIEGRFLPTKKRSRLAENHAIPRFEQLADLGLISKDISGESTNQDELEKRTQWSYKPTERLYQVARILAEAIASKQPQSWPRGSARVWDILGSYWMEMVGAADARYLDQLDLKRDRVLVGGFLDKGYGRASRSYGFTQFHSVAVEASLAAMSAGYRLEMSDSLEFALQLQRMPELSEDFRFSGEPTLARLTCTFKRSLSEAIGGEGGRQLT